jgi:hypothetical protein
MRIRISCFLLSASLALPLAAEEVKPAMVTSAEQAGITRCIDKVKQIGGFVTGGRPHATYDVWATEQTDKRPFSSFVVKGWSDGDSHVSMIVGLDGSGRCFAEYNETSYWPKACGILREESFKALKFKSALKETTMMLTSEDGAMHVYLTPQGEGRGCLSTKRELAFY